MLAVVEGHFPPRFSNPGFRNVRTPLSTAASKDKPYLSIPIVLTPDGKLVPKPGQISYQYLSQNGQRGSSKARGLPSNYQVIELPPSFVSRPKQNKKSARNSVSGSASRRPTIKNNNPQPQLQYQNAKFMQQPNVQHAISVSQRNPNQQIVTNRPANNDAYQQSVLNFINFATHLGSQMVAQQHDNTRKNQLQSTDVVFGTPESAKMLPSYVVQSPSPSNDAQSRINMYSQSPSQGNNAQQIQQQATGYTMPQMQSTQVLQAPVNFQYGHSRHQVQQAGQQQASVQNQAQVQQNLAPTAQFPETQKNAAQATAYFQQTLPQNYVVVSTPQESGANIRSLNNAHFDQQVLKNVFNTQAQVEIPNYNTNAQIKSQNYVNPNQEGQTYITSDGQQIQFASLSQTSPVTYPTQQNLQQQVVNQNPSLNIQTQGNQKYFYSYQNHPQDLSTSYASSANHAQSNNAAVSPVSQQNDQTQYRSLQAPSQNNGYSGEASGQQVAYKIQPQPSLESQQAEPASYTYGQPSYPSSGQKQESSPGAGGKLIYATSSAKEIHYSSSGQGYSNPPQKNNEDSYFSDSSSSYKVADEDDDVDSSTSDQAIEDGDDESEDNGEEETSYKVVYIPLDILKGILNNNNSLDLRRSDKATSAVVKP
ncbi:hypothetical protein JTE90_003865 [Oedothorax gibbosus]|uniref:Uncharacterized protein n=1 Tax=Oedothorax gibbosus TaxID=931172 RepID=A0AAV6UJ42_9ARAC|nr:hypothetical protein JTE90_003865 [Oedothorax gibbosus]